jgi:uncharacterized protein YjbI with pentapeptide repeats
VTREWERFFDLAARRKHHQWLNAGRTGEGRIDVADLDMTNIDEGGARIPAARLTRCRLDGAKITLSTLDEWELIDCTGPRFNLVGSNLRRAVIRGGSFPNAEWRLVRFDGARIEGTDLREANFGRTTFDDGVLEDVSFAGAYLHDTTMEHTVLRRCNLQGADLRRTQNALSRHGTARGARFERCDLRGVDFDGRRLGDTVFNRCAFHGIKGKPELQGPVTILEPDLSPNGDGSEIGDAAAVLDAWS